MSWSCVFQPHSLHTFSSETRSRGPADNSSPLLHAGLIYTLSRFTGNEPIWKVVMQCCNGMVPCNMHVTESSGETMLTQTAISISPQCNFGNLITLVWFLCTTWLICITHTTAYQKLQSRLSISIGADRNQQNWHINPSTKAVAVPAHTRRALSRDGALGSWSHRQKWQKTSTTKQCQVLDFTSLL